MYILYLVAALTASSAQTTLLSASTPSVDLIIMPSSPSDSYPNLVFSTPNVELFSVPDFPASTQLPFPTTNAGSEISTASPVSRWECAQTNGSMMGEDIEFYFPNVNNFLNNSAWQDSMPGTSYLYPVATGQINCGDIVTDIAFCYESETMDPLVVPVFNIHILTQTENYFHVLQSVILYKSPFNLSFCEINSIGNYYCCERRKLASNETIKLPTESFIIGFSIPDSTQSRLQQFGSLYTYSSAIRVNFTIPFATGSNFSIPNAVPEDVPLQFVRLYISKFIT